MKKNLDELKKLVEDGYITRDEYINLLTSSEDPEVIEDEHYINSTSTYNDDQKKESILEQFLLQTNRKSILKIASISILVVLISFGFYFVFNNYNAFNYKHKADLAFENNDFENALSNYTKSNKIKFSDDLKSKITVLNYYITARKKSENGDFYGAIKNLEKANDIQFYKYADSEIDRLNNNYKDLASNTYSKLHESLLQLEKIGNGTAAFWEDAIHDNIYNGGKDASDALDDYWASETYKQSQSEASVNKVSLDSYYPLMSNAPEKYISLNEKIIKLYNTYYKFYETALMYETNSLNSLKEKKNNYITEANGLISEIEAELTK